MENKNYFSRQIEERKKIKDVPIDICITVIINKKDMHMNFNNELHAVNFLMDIYAKRMILKEDANNSKNWIFSKRYLRDFEDILE